MAGTNAIPERSAGDAYRVRALERRVDFRQSETVPSTMFNPPDHRLSVEQYTNAADALHVLTGMLLFEFARHSETEIIRDQIARNFTARADALVRGIFRLWEIPDYNACWILHRTLLDRLFHLHDLNKKDQFDVFNDWSLKMEYEAAERLRSDPAMKGQLNGLVEQSTPERKAPLSPTCKEPS